MKQKKRGFIPALIVTVSILAGLFLLLYPTVASYIASLNYRRDIDGLQTRIERMDDEKRQEMLDEARMWNEQLLKKSSSIGGLDAELQNRYASLLDPAGTGMMGFVEIKKIDAYLPIYHGTDEGVLQSGIGHLAGSSLPVGGAGTHAILTGHTGLAQARLFSDIDKLAPGDAFAVHVLGEVLTYQVESMEVVLPEEAEKQSIDPGKDICTLVTCTPFGINTHRLLVRGIRVETPADAAVEQEIADGGTFPIWKGAVLAISVILVFIIIFVITRVILKKRRNR